MLFFCIFLQNVSPIIIYLIITIHLNNRLYMCSTSYLFYFYCTELINFLLQLSFVRGFIMYIHKPIDGSMIAIGHLLLLLLQLVLKLGLRPGMPVQ